MFESPKILLISDAPPSSSAGGISQTLANIFKLIEPDQLRILTSEEEVQRYGLDGAFKNNTYTFKKEFLPAIRNRIGVVVNKYLAKLSNLLLQLLPLKSTRQIVQWKPDLIVICPNGIEGVIVGTKLAKELKIPFYIYFMDDWFANESKSWFVGNLHSQVDFLLRQSKGWIMISEYLAEILSTRFAIKQPNTHILHNPVTPWQNENKIYLPKEKMKVAYAGALWDMHFDAFLAFAKALFLMNQKGVEIELVFFGKEQFWLMHKHKMDGLPVSYGGFLNYDDLNSILYKNQYLLVCSSFEERFAPFSASSVQTKITDYMNTGRPIISIGPEYGACNKFIEKNEIGHCIKSNNEEVIVEQLNFILQDVNMGNYVFKSQEMIKSKYNAEYVLGALLHFLDPKK